jgi:hypothetical protein
MIDEIAFHECASLFDIRRQAGSYSPTRVSNRSQSVAVQAAQSTCFAVSWCQRDNTFETNELCNSSQHHSILKLTKTFCASKKTEYATFRSGIQTATICHFQLLVSFDFVMVSTSTYFMQLNTPCVRAIVKFHEMQHFLFTNFINLPLTSNDANHICKNHQNTFNLKVIVDGSESFSTWTIFSNSSE